MNVAKSNLYSIDVSSDVNRLYITCNGIWNSEADIPNLQEDIERATQYLESGFTCCTDMSQLEEASADCHARLSYTKMILMRKGITKDAFVVTGGDVLVINFNAGSTRMTGQTFSSLNDAENWLSLN